MVKKKKRTGANVSRKNLTTKCESQFVGVKVPFVIWVGERLDLNKIRTGCGKFNGLWVGEFGLR